MWAELAKHDSLLLNIALDELMRAAVDGGLGSRRCEQVADTLIAMSSINVRSRVLTKLRRVSMFLTTSCAICLTGFRHFSKLQAKGLVP